MKRDKDFINEGGGKSVMDEDRSDLAWRLRCYISDGLTTNIPLQLLVALYFTLFKFLFDGCGWRRKKPQPRQTEHFLRRAAGDRGLKLGSFVFMWFPFLLGSDPKPVTHFTVVFTGDLLESLVQPLSSKRLMAINVSEKQMQVEANVTVCVIFKR